MPEQFLVPQSPSLLAPSFFAPTGSAPSNRTGLDVPETVVMVHHVQHPSYMALLPHALPVWSNQFSASFLPSPLNWATKSMVVMLKTLMHIRHPQRHLLSSPLMTHMQNGMSIVFQKKLDRAQVLPVLHALQGHPESGKLWEKHITGILESAEFGSRSTTHDRSIHSATFLAISSLSCRNCCM